MNKSTDKDNVLQLAQGAILEQANIEMQKILMNILDINTHPDKAREMTIRVIFLPQNNRQSIAVKACATSKLLPNNAVATQMAIGIDRSTGVIKAQEMLPQVSGQINFDGEETPAPVIVQFQKKAN